jgi:NADPH:quinone reductase-like Zn-dependent oxidoreductase
VVDYTKETVDATAVNRGKWDKIIDAVGRRGWRPLLDDGGAVIAVGLPRPESESLPCTLCEVPSSPWCCCCLSAKKSHLIMQSVESADMQELAGLLAEGRLRSVVGKRLVGLSELLDAVVGHNQTLAQGRVVGKTVCSISAPAEDMHRE